MTLCQFCGLISSDRFTAGNLASFISAPSLKQPLPQPTNATKKPIGSSARKLLIYMRVTVVPSGLRPALGGEGRRENVQTESKTCRSLAEMALSVVRKNPQEPAQTRASRQKKANRLGLAFKVLVVHCGLWFNSTPTALAYWLPVFA